ncbi:MAG: hydrogenase 4 subunit F [Pelosinus sp.]|nr:hydrogenase 4 subunit F [Pelosinus sp.]
MDWFWILMLTPLITGFIAWRIKTPSCAWVQAAGAALTLMAGLALAFQVLSQSALTFWDGFIYIDALGAFNIGLVVFVGFTASLYSIGYMNYELAEGIINERQLGQFYLLFHLFIFSMVAVSVVNSVGLMWVGIELTTIVSALLVGLYKRETALEAAWKYLIMGSVGISFALIGIIFIYLSGVNLLGENPAALNWTVLQHVSEDLNPRWILTAFVFVLVGFGTKAGLAPMHFWLPDAHSQAPSPVSAVLSGVMLNTALYGVLRIYAIANSTLHGQAAQYLIFFGILSIAITVPFILVQHDLKRMLAYSSVEHIGIITLGVGIGGPLGLYGALLHMFNHSMAKSMMFLAAGNINQKYHSKQIERISGVLKSLPITGVIFLVGTFAIAGAPPFNIFISEFTIMMAGFKAGHIAVTVLFISLVVLIFAGMVQYVIKMAFGQAPARMVSGEINVCSTIALFLPLVLVLSCGLYVHPFLSEVIYKVSAILQGVH